MLHLTKDLIQKKYLVSQHLWIFHEYFALTNMDIQWLQKVSENLKPHLKIYL